MWWDGVGWGRVGQFQLSATPASSNHTYHMVHSWSHQCCQVFSTFQTPNFPWLNVIFFAHVKNSTWQLTKKGSNPLFIGFQITIMMHPFVGVYLFLKMLRQEVGIQWRKPVKFNQQSGGDAIPWTPNLFRHLGHSLDQDQKPQVWQKMRQVGGRAGLHIAMQWQCRITNKLRHCSQMMKWQHCGLKTNSAKVRPKNI